MGAESVIAIEMGKITNSLKKNEYSSPLLHFQYLAKLPKAKLPESFFYYYADTLATTGDRKQAKSGLSEYILTFGKKGKYYTQAISSMSTL
jgi:hypothetical protein